MKQAILVILTRLLNSMKAESQRYHSLVIPIIRGAVQPDSVSFSGQITFDDKNLTFSP